MSQREKILNVLEDRGPAGVLNIELNEGVCYRYGARLLELRKEGYNIVTRYVKPGVFRYTLVETVS